MFRNRCSITYVKKCQICGKKATVLLTQIVNGQMSDLALCEDCARKKGLFDPKSLSFGEKFFPEDFKAKVDKLVQELAEETGKSRKTTDTPNVLMQCPACGFPIETYRNTGRLGCPDCFTVFARELETELQPLPTQDGEQTSTVGTGRAELETQLRDAVEKEDYELAATLRDRLKEMP